MTIFGIRNYIKDILEIKRPPTETEGALAPPDHDLYLDGSPYLQDQQHEDQLERESSRSEPSRGLKINLVICNITVWIMFVVAGIECAFASLMQDDLKKDE